MDSITLGRGSMIAITVLRILVGWHFFYEGLTKLTAPSWTAAGYLKQARGPFGEMFRGIAADPIMLANADLVTMWGLTIVGLLLILGLFTRLASVAGIGFILLFYFATPPFIGYFYTVPGRDLHDQERPVRRPRSDHSRPVAAACPVGAGPNDSVIAAKRSSPGRWS
jgi:thiosulfate dehydrogenase [quinone] large subunit